MTLTESWELFYWKIQANRGNAGILDTTACITKGEISFAHMWLVSAIWDDSRGVCLEQQGILCYGTQYRNWAPIVQMDKFSLSVLNWVESSPAFNS